MTPAVTPRAIGLVLLVMGCESDAHQLQRLQTERVTACLSVYQADSARDRHALAKARIESQGATTVQEAQSDVEVLQRELAELRRRMALSPEQMQHEQDSANAARVACQLSERALNRFMAGR